MKKLLQFTLFSVSLLLTTIASAQVSSYSFSQSSNAYTPITGGTVAAASTVSTTLDSEVYSALPIGFTFNFNGSDYSTFGINVNGWISMGSTAPVSTSVPLSGTTNNIISAATIDLYGRQFVTASTTLGNTISVTTGSTSGVSVGDLIFGTGIATGATVVSISGATITTNASGVISTGTGRNIRFANGNIRYQTIGVAPNRQLVVQWNKFSRFATTGGSDNFNFQIVLNETNNKINTVYNFPFVNTANNMQVGLRGATSADFNNRATTTSWSATTSGTTNTATCSVSGTILPASGQTFTWTPSACGAPGSLITSSFTSTTATIGWANNATATAGYNWELRTTGACGSGAPLQSGTTATNSINLSGLSANTTYTYCVQSSCAGPLSSSWSTANFYTGHCLASSTGQLSWISAFSTTGGTANITHTAAAGALGGYVDLTTTNTVSNYLGQTTNFSITSGGPTVGNAIWVDWNNNLVFETTERVYVSTAYGTTVNGSFVIPVSTGLGNYKMRVLTDFNNPAPSNPCGLIVRGEYKDFTFTVVAAPPCADPSIPVISGVTNTSVTATWVGGSPAPALGYKWEVRSSGAGGSGASGLVTSGTTAVGVVSSTSSGLSGNSPYTFYVQAACSTNQSNWMAQSFTTTNLPYVVYSNSNPKSINDTIEVFFEDYDTTNNFFTGSETTIYGYACLNTNAGHFQYCNMDANNVNTLIPFTRQSAGLYKATFKVIDYFCVPTGDVVYTVDMFFRNQYGLGGNNQTGNIELEVTDGGVVINAPTALTSSLVTTTTATISWTAPIQGANKGYEYAFGLTNTPPSTGSSSSVPTANLTDLSSSTLYYFWVRTKGCSPNVSSWSLAGTFITQCAPATITSSDVNRCGAGTAVLSATSSSGSVAWYSTATGGSPLFTGNSYTTPSIGTTTTYYAESQIIPTGGTNFGPTSPSVGVFGTSFTGSYQIFDVSAPVYINTVDVFATVSGNVIVSLLNSAGTVLQTSSTYVVSAAQANSTTTVLGAVITIPLNFSIPVGTGYRLNLATGSTATLLRNSTGATATYGPSNGITITGNSNATVGYFYNFYNWNTSAICASSPRTPVVAIVTPAPSITTSTNVSICNGDSTVLNVTSANIGYQYTWSPAAGLSGTTGANITANPSATTTYTVIAVDPTGCNITGSVTVIVNPVPSTVTIAPTTSLVCADAITPLVASGGTISATANIGSGVVVPSTTSYPNPFSGFYGGAKHQMIYLASELSAQGLITGSSISSLGLNISAFANVACTDLTIRMKSTPSTVLTGIEAGATNVYGPVTYTPSSVGPNNFVLTTPFIWDGTSNIIVEFVHNAGNAGNGSGTTVVCSTTTGNRTFYGAKDTVTGGIAGFDSQTTYSVSGGSTSRPNIRFSYALVAPITWSPTTDLYTDAAATVAYSGAAATTVYHKGAANTYTATATLGTCTKTATTTIALKPNTTIATQPISQIVCSGASVTFSVVGANSSLGYLYEWRKNNVIIAGATNQTYTIASTNDTSAGNYTVVVAGECGPTVTSAIATLTINPVNSISNITVSNTSPLCFSDTTTLTANGVAGTNAIVTWFTGTNGTGTNLGASSTVIVGPGTYYARVTGDCGVAVEASYTINFIEGFVFANLQFPGTATICETGVLDAYGQVYKAGVTEAPGQGSGITVEFGYSTTNTNPSTWTNWSAASFNVQSGNNDEYKYIFTPPSSGAFYYTFRYSTTGCASYQYGGYTAAGGGTLGQPDAGGAICTLGQLTVNAQTVPTFAAIAPLCSGATFALPTTSSNGVAGSWAPAFDNLNSGTYTFTPTSGLCATTATLAITITPQTVPTFAAITPLCSGATFALPTTSSNGVAGSWAPAFDNLNSGTYTFTPTSGLCATTATLAVTIGGTTTWTGAPAAWSNGAPTSTSTAIISANYSEVANIIACTLTVNNNAVVAIPSGNNITLQGALTVVAGSSVTLNSDSNLVQASNVANSGNVIIKRTTPSIMRQDYVLWSSPVASQNLLAFSPQTLVNRFNTYNPTTNFYEAVASPATTNFATGTGYLIRIKNNHPLTPTTWTGTFTGVPNNGPVSLSVTGDTFNAVGNPYPSAISADAFMAANNSSVLYFWRKTNNTTNLSYASYTTAGGVANTGGDPLALIPNGNIQVGQGFLVKSAIGSTALNFTNAMRISGSGPLLRSSENRSRIWLDMTTPEGLFSQTMVAYMPNATSGVDNAIDGRLLSDATNSALSSLIDNEEFAIQGRALPFETSDVVPMAFKSAVAGSYTIAINHVDGLFTTTGQTVYLQDNLTNTVHNLSAAPYTYTTAAGVFNSRFQIVYQPAGTLATTTPTLSENNVIVYKQDDSVVINTGKITMASVKIFDIRGRLLVEKSNINTSNIKLNTGTTNQVLIVKITSITNEVVTKKVIN